MTVKGEKFREIRETRKVIDPEGKLFVKKTITRRIGDDGVFLRTIDEFQNGMNVLHEEKSTLNDESEINQFKKIWASTWSKVSVFGSTTSARGWKK